MGFFWDLVQQSALSSHDDAIRQQEGQTVSLQGRVERLERELRKTRSLLRALVERLETRFGEDVDGNGKVG